MAEQRLTTKAAELVSSPHAGSGKFVDAILLPVEGTPLRVFGLLAAQSDDDVSQQIDRILQTALRNAQRDLGEHANVARRFETLLADLNGAMAALAAEHPTLQLRQVDAIVGFTTEQQLFVSGFGALLALFLHKTADRRFVIYELHAQLAAESELTWDKPFVTILDGELHPGDIFYLATRTPNHAIALSDVQDILVTLPPAGALERIQQFLPQDAAYGALCFHVAEEDKGGAPKKANPIASLAALGHTKAETADLLGEQGSDITGFIRRVIALLSGKLAAPGSRGYKSMLKRMAKFALQFLGAVLIAIVQVVRFVAVLLFTLLRRIFNTQPDGERPLERISRRIRSIPPATKYVAGALLSLALLLIVSISFFSHRSEQRKDEATFASTIATVEEKANAAEASLIYNDTSKAYDLMQEAAALLETLPQNSRAHEAQIEALQTTLATLQAKIRKETLVTLTTVAALGPNDVAMETLTAANGSLYAFAKDGDVLRVNELEHTFSQEIAASGAISGIRSLVGDGANLLFIDSNRRLGRADLTTKTIRPLTSGVEGMASAEDMANYNGALYVLAAASQQIVKMRPQGDGYEAGTPWISNRSSDLSGARDITIDGTVYVLTTDDVVQFRSSKEVTWTHDAFDPALKNPIDIWTDIESTYLYILDPGSSRLVVYEKESGKLAMQYTSPDFASAIGFVVREDTNTIIIATGTKVASFSATHLLQ